MLTSSPPLRAVLVRPQLAGGRMQRRALDVAVAVAPDLRHRVLAADERIVVGHRAVRRDAHDLADVVAEVLRLLRMRAVIAQRQEQIVVRRLHDPAAEVPATRRRAVLAEDDFHVFQPVAGQPRARHRGVPAAALMRLGEAEIDGLVLREIAVERDVVQPALARCINARHAGQRRREFALGADDAEPAGPLRHQQAAAGQEGERPGIGQSARGRLHREIAG